MQLTTRIKSNIRRLKNEIHEISPATLRKKPRPEKWSRLEILGHLIDSARYNMARFTEIPLADGLYEVSSYPQDALVKINAYQTLSVAELVILWQSLNTQICTIIEQTSASALQKRIRVASETKTLQWLMEDYVLHMEYHLAQILAADETDKTVLHYHFSPENAKEQLRQVSGEFVKLLAFGDLEVEYYKPDKIDKQQPHTKDELYVIAKGHGTFEQGRHAL